jgi:hypothetical protein
VTGGLLAPRLAVGPVVAAAGATLASLMALLFSMAMLAGSVVGGGSAAPIDAARLDAWMASKVPTSPLVGLGGVFVASGVASGVDPRLLVAIARQESALGTAGGGASIHNAFGWGPHIPFESWEENIATVARGLASGYLSEGRTTIPAIGAKWAPIGASNDPTNLNSHWVRGVSGSYAELGGDPSGAVTLDAANVRGPAGMSTAGLAWPSGGVITSPFGPRWGRLHAGLDIGGRLGDPIGAAAAGSVTSAGWAGGYGNRVVLDHGGGLTTVYGHLDAITVTPGQVLVRGDPLGAMGTTGNSTGVHLHFEIRIGGQPVDPLPYLTADEDAARP